jgi:hypothetical protein
MLLLRLLTHELNELDLDDIAVSRVVDMVSEATR